MNELEKRYVDAMFAGRYPQAVLEMEAAQEKASKARAEAAAPKEKPQAEAKEIDRNAAQKAIGNMGALIQSWAEQLDKFGVKIQIPGGGEVNPTLKDVTVGDMGKVLEDISFGFYPVQGSGMTKGLKSDAVELMNLPILAAPATAIKAVVKGGKAAKAVGAAAAASVASDAAPETDAPQPKKKDKVLKFDSEGRPFPTGGNVRAPVRG